MFMILSHAHLYRNVHRVAVGRVGWQRSIQWSILQSDASAEWIAAWGKVLATWGTDHDGMKNKRTKEKHILIRVLRVLFIAQFIYCSLGFAVTCLMYNTKSDIICVQAITQNSALFY